MIGNALGRAGRMRFGISAKLYLAIGGAVALTLAASVVAWISFVELGQHQRRITREHIPSITDSLRLAQQSALIAATAPKLMTAADEAERRLVIEDLGRQQLALAQLIQDLGEVLAARPSPVEDELPDLETIRVASRDLALALEQLDQTVARRLELRFMVAARSQAVIDAHRRLVERLTPLLDDATFYLVTGYRGLEDAEPAPREVRTAEPVLLEYEAMARLGAEANLLSGLLAEAATTPEIPLLQPLRERFEASADRFERALVVLRGAAAADELHGIFRSLTALGPGDFGIFALRARFLSEQAAAAALVERSRELAQTLTQQVGLLVEAAERGTGRAVALSNRAIDIGQKLLFVLNAISIIGAVVIAWGYVARRITAPVVRITEAAKAFEAQRFEPASLASVRERTDELGNLARVFTGMAEQVQARTDLLDRLVAERTQELNQKNVALERSLKQIAEELAMAERMQLSILPKHYPDLPHLKMFARMRAAREVGGDFYDIIEIDRNRVGVAIADVSGKGVPAALFMAVSCTIIKSIAGRGGGPGEVLAAVNDLLCEGNEASMFVTVFYAIVDHRTGRLTYANGGHNPPYITRPGDPVAPIEGTDGMALGVMPGMNYEERSIALNDGDTVFFYTDGITEAFNPAGRAFSDLRLREVLYRSQGLSVEALGREVMGNVEEFADGAPQSDDITCVVIRFQRAADTAPQAA